MNFFQFYFISFSIFEIDFFLSFLNLMTTLKNNTLCIKSPENYYSSHFFWSSTFEIEIFRHFQSITALEKKLIHWVYKTFHCFWFIEKIIYIFQFLKNHEFLKNHQYLKSYQFSKNHWFFSLFEINFLFSFSKFKNWILSLHPKN